MSSKKPHPVLFGVVILNLLFSIFLCPRKEDFFTGHDSWLGLALFLCKPAALAGVLVHLVVAYQQLAVVPRSGIRLSVLWFVAGLLAIIGLLLTREPVAAFLSDGNLCLIGPEGTWMEEEYGDDWGRWRPFKLFVSETGLLAALIALHLGIGIKLGARRVLAPVAGVFGTVALLFFFEAAFGNLWFTYDVFVRSLFAGALLIDLVLFFVPLPPFGVLAALVYLLAVWTLRIWMARTPAVVHDLNP